MHASVLLLLTMLLLFFIFFHSSHTKLQGEKTELEEMVVRRAAELDSQQEKLVLEKERLAEEEVGVADRGGRATE